jgi:O-antigen/teichoic acid export membrane protein
MLNTSGLLYLSARAMSAAGNLLAVAIFSRMAGPAEYGHYVFIFAWALIVYGFGAQWIRFAYFGVYHLERFGEYVASLARLLTAGLVAVAVVLAGIGLFGVFEPGFLVAVFALVCGIAIYEAAFEVARTLLNARGASFAMILRSVLTIGFGSLALSLGGGALGLALAIAVAHLIAAAPALATFANVRWSHWSQSAALHIVGYGWPLLLSFGVTAVGQSIDRLLLAHYLGLATLGPYGVVADLLRQSFTVLGEAIILSLVTVAKTLANRGDDEGAAQTLQKAFNACLAAATFGAAFFIVFGDAVLRVVLQPEFAAPMHDLIPIFAIAFAFATMRNFYFAQVIYFTTASYLDLVVALLFLGVSTALSLLLVPHYGPHGAALALMVASIAACVAFMALGQRWYRMPVDFGALIIMPTLAGLCVLGAHVMAGWMHGPAPQLLVNAAIFAVCGGFAVRHFRLLSLPSAEAAVGSATVL